MEILRIVSYCLELTQKEALDLYAHLEDDVEAMNEDYAKTDRGRLVLRLQARLRNVLNG